MELTCVDYPEDLVTADWRAADRVAAKLAAADFVSANTEWPNDQTLFFKGNKMTKNTKWPNEHSLWMWQTDLNTSTFLKWPKDLKSN